MPAGARATLDELRRTINSVAPGIEESIGHGMPAFKYKGRPLVYFAAAKNHCALYGTSEGTIRFSSAAPLAATRVQALVSARIERIETATLAGRGRLRPSKGNERYSKK